MSYRSAATIVASLLLSFFTPTTFAKQAVVEVNNLNVRSGPGTEYERIGQVQPKKIYDIIDENENWVKINIKKGYGWVSKEFITISNVGELKDNQFEKSKINLVPSTIVIKQDGIHLREGPSTDYPIIYFTKSGQEFDVISETDNWLEFSNDEASGFVLRNHTDLSNGENGLKNKTIVIDPGHGGRDVGAIGNSGTFEKYFTYLTALELEKELLALGANVILIRRVDEFIPLESRSVLANTIDTDVFLSIHYNSFPEVPSVNGIETFYYQEQYSSLATYIHEGIIKETNERDRGISFGDFYVTRQTFKPSALLELGFISNPESEALLQLEGYQQKIVTGIINGLQKYFTMNP